LWCVRVYKTRTLAASQCKLGKVWVNEELIKASRELRLGDQIKVRKGPVHFTVRVLEFPKARIGAKLLGSFIKDITTPDELAKLELIKLQARDLRPRGLGRPSKKERRLLDDFMDLEEFGEEDEQWK